MNGMEVSLSLKEELSVLIPTYNHCCLELVGQLADQLQAAGIRYEILVADDGSTDAQTIDANRAMDRIPYCRYIVRQRNVGRAAIRNYLAQVAQYRYLLFVDSDMTIPDLLYIRRYLECPCDTVINGGIVVAESSRRLKSSLRHRYEKAEEPRHTATQRRLTPYQHLHTANLLVRRDLMLRYPFDERFRHYGYEDVMLGKTFRQHHVPIEHIDNPLGFCIFESNPDFVAKTEEGLRTLHAFQAELRGYSRLLTFTGNIHIGAIRSLFRLWHRLFGLLERRWLCGPRPSLFVFRLYRLGYFLTLPGRQPRGQGTSAS